MGIDSVVHDASQSECYTSRLVVHLPIEKVQSWGSWKKGQRVSLDDDCIDDGQ